MHTTSIEIRLTALVLCFCIPAAAAGRIIYVDADATGANNGLNWSNAYNHLQDALADAAPGAKPVQIRVAGGLYRPDERAGVTPGNRQATFQMINGATVSGGYAGFGEAEPDARDIEAYETVLSGDLAGDDVGSANNAENSYHVVTGSGANASAVLDGFTIAGGNANGLGDDSSGGGMFNASASSPAVANCVFSGNLAAMHGGGMYNEGSCSPTLTDCTFSNNSAVGYGG
ncbi:MAG: hypothetical protein JXN61_11070, partial [Sedimentisphaerales bacterium]|nr:hypothetical protein [Sedimentisphaerales bacterium]